MHCMYTGIACVCTSFYYILYFISAVKRLKVFACIIFVCVLCVYKDKHI